MSFIWGTKIIQYTCISCLSCERMLQLSMLVPLLAVFRVSHFWPRCRACFLLHDIPSIHESVRVQVIIGSNAGYVFVILVLKWCSDRAYITLQWEDFLIFSPSQDTCIGSFYHLKDCLGVDIYLLLVSNCGGLLIYCRKVTLIYCLGKILHFVGRAPCLGDSASARIWR